MVNMMADFSPDALAGRISDFLDRESRAMRQTYADLEQTAKNTRLYVKRIAGPDNAPLPNLRDEVIEQELAVEWAGLGAKLDQLGKDDLRDRCFAKAGVWRDPAFTLGADGNVELFNDTGLDLQLDNLITNVREHVTKAHFMARLVARGLFAIVGICVFAAMALALIPSEPPAPETRALMCAFYTEDPQNKALAQLKKWENDARHKIFRRAAIPESGKKKMFFSLGEVDMLEVPGRTFVGIGTATIDEEFTLLADGPATPGKEQAKPTVSATPTADGRVQVEVVLENHRPTHSAIVSVVVPIRFR